MMLQFHFTLQEGVFSISENGGLYLNTSVEQVQGILPEEVICLHMINNRFIIEFGDIDVSRERCKFERTGKQNICRTETACCEIKDMEQFVLEVAKYHENIIFYTGAGISREAGIPVQDELRSQLYLDNLPMLYCKSVYEPQELIHKFKIFCFKIGLAKPTQAHHMLAQIIQRNGGTVVTENLDKLHEKTGIIPLRPFNNNEIYRLKPAAVLFAGVGNPECISLIREWADNGVKFYAVSIQMPDIKGIVLQWCKCDVQSFFTHLTTEYNKLKEKVF